MTCHTDPRITHVVTPEGTVVTFDDYTRTVEFLVLMGRHRQDRIAAAWHAGGGSGPVPALGNEPYLYERMRLAFERGSKAR